MIINNFVYIIIDNSSCLLLLDYDVQWHRNSCSISQNVECCWTSTFVYSLYIIFLSLLLCLIMYTLFP